MTEHRCALFKNGDMLIEHEESDNTYNVPGCCGGGCWVLQDIQFCPFCGEKLHKEKPT